MQSLGSLYIELCVSTSEALEILSVVNRSKVDASSTAAHSHVDDRGPGMGGKSAYQLLQEEQAQPFIVTFSAKVDEMLGGGIPMGKITELCGAPGIGKTQFR